MNLRSNGSVTGLGIGAAILFIAGVILAQGWLAMILWGAIAPIFDGSTISYPQGIAVGVAVAFVTSLFRRER